MNTVHTVPDIAASGLRANGYYFDMINNSFYMNRSFERKAKEYNSREFLILAEALSYDAGLNIYLYVAASRGSSGPTYQQMEKYIMRNPSKEAVKKLDEYERIRLMSHSQRSPYKYVLSWFMQAFPEYFVA